MAFQPSPRPAGSAHVMRFSGSAQEGVALNVFPKTNGTFPSGIADASPVGLRLLLADSDHLENQLKRFPSHVYDDAQPAGAAPHAPVATSLVAGVVNADEESVALKTWAQNLRLTLVSKAANILTVDLLNFQVVLDTATSGLGLDSGLPVLIIPLTLTDNQTASLIDLIVEIPATGSR